MKLFILSYAIALTSLASLGHVLPEHRQTQQQVLHPSLSTSPSHDQGLHGILRRFEISQGVQQLEEVIQIAQEDDLDIWQVTPDHIDIYFPPSTTGNLMLPNALSSIPHTSQLIPISPPRPKSQLQELPSPNPNPSTNPNWTLPLFNSTYHASYHPLFEIEAFTQTLADEHPDRVSVVRVGLSGEQRELVGFKISSTVKEDDGGDEDGDESGSWWKKKGKKGKKGEKMGFVITGAQHAREWVATSTAVYLTHALLTNTSAPNGTGAGGLAHLLDKFDFYIIPSPNPDGYDWTWESDRFWYKNRMQTGPDTTCIGVDMNRNWGYKWRPTVSLQSSSTNATRPHTQKKPTEDPCSHWYPGNRAFQAPETSHIATWVESLPNLKAFVDMRSYGQMLSSPYSYSCEVMPKDAEYLLEAASGAISALRKPYGTSFVTGSLCSMFYHAHGNIVDWMYKRAGIKYSYAAHLRDTGTYGFALPAYLIRPVGEETAKMIEYLANFIAIWEK